MAYNFYLFVLVVLCSSTSIASSISTHKRPPYYLINFGDSNTDTGAFCPLVPSWNVTCRASNGRVYLDFLCELLGINYLTPYTKTVTPDFSHGANFAYSGATADDEVTYGFPLKIEVNQFSAFQNHTKGLLPKAKGKRTPQKLRKALFSIDIVQNDLSFHYMSELPPANLTRKIARFVSNIENATKALYEFGGRKFLIYSTGPLGCLPHFHAQGGPLDSIGCAVNPNSAARAFNELLNSTCSRLRVELKKASIVYVDMYSIKYNIIAHSSKYGFDHPFTPCLDPKLKVCVDPSRKIFWDMVHYTDASSKLVAKDIWLGKFSSPGIKFRNYCKL